MDWIAWHGRALTDHINLANQYTAQGYGFISLSIYGSIASPYYAAVMIRPTPSQQHHHASVPGNQIQQTFNSEAARGYGPAIIAATGAKSNPMFAAVFEPQNPVALTRWGLPSGSDPWHLQQINNGGMTAGPAVVGGLFVSVYNNQQHFVYRDVKGNIQDAWFGGGAWHLQQLTRAPATVVGEWIVPTPGPAAAGDVFVNVYNNQQHFVYRDAGGNIQDVWFDGGTWHLQLINNGGMTAGPAAVDDPFVSVYNNQQHFVYRAAKGNIQDAWFGGGAWHLQQLTRAPATVAGEWIVPTPGPAAAGDVFVSVYNNQQHFVYRDVNNNIQDVWFDGGAWHLQQINNGGMTAGPAAVDDPFVSVYNSQQHFAYLDAKGNIQDAWFGGGTWHLQQLTRAPATVVGEWIVPTPGPAAAGDVFVSVYNNQQHFVYRDAGGNIQDVWFDGGTWHLQQINMPGMTNGPPAVGDPFVSVYNNQQHFTYRDGGGSLQDAWYDGGPDTIQGLDVWAKRWGLILRWAAAYGDSADPAFLGVWIPNTGGAHWNNDGIAESASDYQARFDAEFSGWCRPAFVTLNASGQYLSLFVDDQIGPWQARHNLTPADYQAAFDSFKQQGYFPVCVQAAGADANSATFAAIFAKSRDVVAKSFSPTGPVANAQIDAIIQQMMQNSGVRHAALAIVHGTQLVYARGYTLAEPGWPIAQPTTCFRLASVSKTPTAIAIYQLIQEKKLKLGDTLQNILGLQTPSGGAPSDKRFNQITIQQLLEHTSGLNPGGYDEDVAVRNAFKAAGKPATLPVSTTMTDSYVASLPLQSNPGATQVYNNCGYNLLGRVVAKLRNQSRPIDAYQQYLFKPLSITRIRRAVSLVANQPLDEARYQNYDLPVYPSVMSDAQPLVPDVYGNVQLEFKEGAGGLTGAATDLARLVAILISQKDNPALTRATLKSMLSAGATLTAAGFGRAGHGFDELYESPSNPHGLGVLGSGQFYGQKGGSLASCGAELQFNGDWGFTMLSGSGHPNQWSYPDFPAVMNIAKSTNWGAGDLFPQFGMPSLS